MNLINPPPWSSVSISSGHLYVLQTTFYWYIFLWVSGPGSSSSSRHWAHYISVLNHIKHLMQTYLLARGYSGRGKVTVYWPFTSPNWLISISPGGHRVQYLGRCHIAGVFIFQRSECSRERNIFLFQVCNIYIRGGGGSKLCSVDDNAQQRSPLCFQTFNSHDREFDLKHECKQSLLYLSVASFRLGLILQVCLGYDK